MMKKMGLSPPDSLMYIGGSETLPPPLTGVRKRN
jgi:hypothetical protein